MPDRVPLSVLDLVPVAEGSDARAALADSVDLARRVEALGYRRFWLAEHHLNPGNAGSAPLTLLGVLAAATHTIRLGTAATLIGHISPLQAAEAAGLIATLFDGRMDLGLGRTPPRRPAAGHEPTAAGPTATATASDVASAPRRDRAVDGLFLPAPARTDWTRGRFGLLGDLLARPDTPPFADSVAEVLSYLDGDFHDADGSLVPVLPATGSGAAVWVHGSSGGESARVAGALGLPFGANYHSAPAGVLDAVATYRESFRPDPLGRPGRLAEPYVIVSADVLVAGSVTEADDLARGFAPWVLSVREGTGTIAYPSAGTTPELTPAQREAVADRVRTRFVGTAERVVAGLEVLQRATGADELLVTTGAPRHEHRVCSYELLADAWGM